MKVVVFHADDVQVFKSPAVLALGRAKRGVQTICDQGGDIQTQRIRTATAREQAAK